MKHAFLIIAHTNWNLLRRLLQKLDFLDSNIYLHIDAKSAISQSQLQEIKNVCRYATVHMVPRKKVSWGGYSLIDCELTLLKTAVRDNNDYYHFMSGNDYLLVSEEKFKAFFNQNNGKKFIGFSRNGFAEQERQRYQVYHFLQEKVGRKRNGLYWVEKVLVKLQMGSRLVDRTRKFGGIRYAVGSEWCSLTKSFVLYLLDKEQMIQQMFKRTFCCDEVFVQTIFVNSPFKNNNFQGTLANCGENTQNVRGIDWKRGRPYTYECSDYKELIESDNIFVRKVYIDTPERERLLDLLDMRKD